MSKLLVFEGYDCSGKSTVAKRIADDLGYLYVTPWSLFSDGTNSHIKSSIMSRPHDSRSALILWITHHMELMQLVSEILSDGRGVVMDRNIVSTFVYQASNHIRIDEFTNLCETIGYSDVPTIDKFYLLTVEKDVMQVRLDSRVDQHDELDNFAIDNYRQIKRAYYTGLNHLVKSNRDHVIDTSSHTIEELYDRIKGTL